MNMKRVLVLGALMGGLMGCPNSDSKIEQPKEPELIGVEDTHVVWGVETVEEVGVESEVSGAISSQSATGESPNPKNKNNEGKETEEVPTRNEGSRETEPNLEPLNREPPHIQSLRVYASKLEMPIFSSAELTVELKTSQDTIEVLERDQFTLNMNDPTAIRLTETGKIIGLKQGEVTFSVEAHGLTSPSLTITITPPLKICGVLNDTDKNNAKGDCLKVIEGLTGDANGKYFSSSPSLAFLKQLNYSVDNTPDNVGRSYAKSVQGLGSYAPITGLYARFRQDGAGENDGVGGQYDRYCQDLAELAYASRVNWRRVTANEVAALVQDHGELYTAFGFPTLQAFWTSSNIAPELTTQSAGTSEFLYATGFDYSARIQTSSKSMALMAICVSEIQDSIQVP
ncbi:hypothetical protein Q8W42_18200 [Vibrio splendidus]|uniref:BIG2 domain-containing protein n=1 Tax=Vibrio splendidus TaxID=29497 RepID=A0AB35N1S1_VIBSP|nr:hypothetical protein [Vibrio splendidus]MDP2502651.1 hypothetical protein [Vibrio splendidus]